MPPLLTKAQAAKSLQVCLRTMDNLMVSKAIEFIRIGRAVRFKQEALADFLASQTVNARPAFTN